MPRKKSLSVLITLLYKTVSSVQGDLRQSLIRQIEGVLVDAGIFTKSDVIAEEVTFTKFVNTIQRYMDKQEMTKDDALELALKRFPQYRNANELLN